LAHARVFYFIVAVSNQKKLNIQNIVVTNVETISMISQAHYLLTDVNLEKILYILVK